MAEAISLAQRASELAADAGSLARALGDLAQQLVLQAHPAEAPATPFVYELTVFVLAVFVGYHVVWRVTPALHSPLMSVTNAISSVIIVGALIAAGPLGVSFAKVMGFLAVTLAAVNIFGGFIVTQRMLQMFQRKR
jgi:H+-translocating NAD(P) transhydrogenase subunit alpha